MEQVLKEKKAGLSFFEKYLVGWIVLCMAAGIAISKIMPGVATAINAAQVGGISVPIGICLFMMMYPAVLNLQLDELKKLTRNPKPILLTLVANWIFAPIIGLVMANLFLDGHPELKVAIILLSASPCTAMVLVWGAMAEGNQEQNVVNTGINTITIMFLYAPLVALMTGLQDIPIDRMGLAISVLVFIGLPIVLGLISRKYITAVKGQQWFVEVYRPFVGKLAIVALLITLVVLFALNGNTLLLNPEYLLLVSVPLLLGFAIILVINILLTKLFRLQYKEAIITVIIGSSSHFEIAIATAIAAYGVGSVAALGTTMGLFWEIPIMLSIVYLGKYLRDKNFWK